MNVRILMADDHEVLREGVKSLLARFRPDWNICGEVTDGEEAIRLARTLKPDLVILDITMPGMSGLEAASQMRKFGFAFPILIFTTHQADRLAAEVREVGAQGYVLKSQAARSLVLAINQLAAGGTFFDAPPEAQSEKKGKFNFGILLLRTSALHA